MTIYNTAYDTTVGSGIVTKTIEQAIEKSFVQDMTYYRSLDVVTNLSLKPVFISGAEASESNIPFFTHPLVVKNGKGHEFLCVDIRPFIRNSNDGQSMGQVVPRNRTEFDFVKSRSILNMAWLTGASNQIKTNLNFAGVVFANWLSDVISKRFALDPKDQMLLTIVSHYYYQSLFYAEDTFDEDMLQQFAVHTINASKAPSKMVFDVFDRIGKMGSVGDYCDNVKLVLDNIRLTDLNVGLLITMIGQSWYGLNAKEILAVALEHPPTWNAVVFAAINERTYKNSPIARLAERFSKQGNGVNYTRGYNDLLSNYVVEETSNAHALDGLM